MRDERYLNYWEELYHKPNAFGSGPTKLAKFAESIIKEKKVRRILEIGCGQGRDTIHFSQLGFEVTAFDVSPNAIEFVNKTKESLGLKNLNVSIHDIEKPLDYPDEHFDFVYSNLVLQFFPSSILHTIFRNISKVMGKNSFFLLSTKKEGDKYFKLGTKVGEYGFQYKGITRYFFDSKVLKDMLSDKFEIIQFDSDSHTNPDSSISIWWKILLKKL